MTVSDYDMFYTDINCMNPGQELNSLPQLIGVGMGTIDSPTYRWFASRRKDKPHIIFQLTLSGYGCFKHSGKVTELHKGMAFLCDAYDTEVEYYYPERFARKGCEPWRFVYITFAGNSAIQMVRDIVSHFGYIYKFDLTNSILSEIMAIKTLKQRFYTMSLGKGTKIVFDLLNSLIEIHEKSAVQTAGHALIRRAQNVISENSSTSLNVSELAQKLNVSREHLSRVFTDVIGDTPYHFIQKIKMRFACDLLEQSDMTVKDISQQLGYQSQADFCRVFKRVMNVAPSEFRA